MALNDHQGEVVAEGVFLYDGTTPMTIHIVAHNYDCFYAMNDEFDYLEPGSSQNRLVKTAFSIALRRANQIYFRQSKTPKNG